MGIAPIDLQTLFTQLDKVAKTQNAQTEGQILQQAMHNTRLQRKTEEHVQSVNEAQNMGEGIEQVKDRDAEHNHAGGGKKGKDQDSEGEEAEDQASVFRDPSLGQKIDISL
jgi:hypothetical protein